jgi:hypothetical protein
MQLKLYIALSLVIENAPSLVTKKILSWKARPSHPGTLSEKSLYGVGGLFMSHTALLPHTIGARAFRDGRI